MKKIVFILVCYGLCFPMNAQSVAISETTTVSVEAGLFQLNHMHLFVDGNMVFDSTSSLIFSAKSKEYTFRSSETPQVHVLKIGGDIRLDMDSLSISGDITFFQKGILNIDESKVILSGNILNEDNEKHLTSSNTGAIIKKIQMLPFVWYDVMGLRLWLNEASSTIMISRSHQCEQRRNENSILRHFSFSQPLQIGKMVFPFWDSERNGVTEPMLSFQTSVSSQWDFAEVGIHSVSQDKNKIQAENLQDIHKLTIFSYPSLSYPSYFTPNGDGLHDTYLIEGSEKYGNSRFVVLNAQGKSVFESSPYRNNFSGESLVSGTYYFLFFTSKDDKRPKKGSFELIR